MSDFYGASHRRLQEAHDTRRLADRLEQLAHVAISDDERAFIESRTVVFLATVDHLGRPTVSYKGGPPGFVRVLEDNRLVLPSYDGNGMFLSLGNIAADPRVGLLFIDFEHPRRLRLQGRAAVLDDDPLLASFAGARSIVRITPERVFVNCGRYIHKPGEGLSRHLPDAGGCQPFPNWKRIDVFSDVLPAGDAQKVAEAGGTMALEDYGGEDEDRPAGRNGGA